jgi:hypothetical protein
MRATIWMSESGTTGAQKPDVLIKDYYQGATFRPAAILENNLNDIYETDLYVLLDKGGYVKGDESSTVLSDPVNTHSKVEEAIIDSISEADIVVILLPSKQFDINITGNWELISRNAKKESIWCIGTSKGSLQNIDIRNLEVKDCTVFTYERVGVAPIGKETRAELINAAQSRVD